MASPSGVSVAPGVGPLVADPDWTRLDDPDAVSVVASWEINRGRATELEKTPTGTGTVELMDENGVVDPTNVDGPLADALTAMTQSAIALRNPVTDEWSTLFRGYVGDADQEVDVSEAFETGEVSFVDAFDYFAQLEMHPTHFGDPVPADVAGLSSPEGDIYFADDPALDAVQRRMNGALDDAGWPAELREIFTGNVGLQENTYARASDLLEVLMDAADAEFPGGVSNVFMSKLGWVTFHGRKARFNPDDVEYHIRRWIVGDEAAFAADDRTAIISGLQFGPTPVYNSVFAFPEISDVKLDDVLANHIEDADSIAAYGRRSLSMENLLTRNGDGTTAVEETRKFARYYVDNYAQPRTRLKRIRFRGQAPNDPRGPRLWALLCGIDISDILNVTTSHPGGGGVAGEDFFVEGLHYQAQPLRGGLLDVTLDVDVSPAALYAVDPF